MGNCILHRTPLLSLFREDRATRHLIHRKQQSSPIIHRHKHYSYKLYPHTTLVFMQNQRTNLIQYNDVLFHTKYAFDDYISLHYDRFIQNARTMQKRYFKAHPTEAKQYLFSILGGKDTMSLIQRFFTNRLTWKERSLLKDKDSLWKENMSERVHSKETVLKELFHHYQEAPIQHDYGIFHQKERISQTESQEQVDPSFYQISEEDLERIIDEVYEKIAYQMKIKSYSGG